ncbi:MAG: signal peptidase I [Clostridium sp.]|nr:signal peptidase I [Clostridium sp.]
MLEDLRAGRTGINRPAEEPAPETEEVTPDSSGEQENAGEAPPENPSLLKEILSWIPVLAAAVVIAFLLDYFIIANSTVPTGSMETTIMPGDRVIGLRLKYTFGEPERGDIAIFIYPDDEAAGIRTYYVKRIIGMPGDTVDVKDGHVYLNGSSEPLDESMIKEPMMPEEPMHFEVPENCYFMLGDNRNYSNDSRRWHTPYVERSKLIAKVYFKYFPGIKWLN